PGTTVTDQNEQQQQQEQSSATQSQTGNDTNASAENSQALANATSTPSGGYQTAAPNMIGDFLFAEPISAVISNEFYQSSQTVLNARLPNPGYNRSKLTDNQNEQPLDRLYIDESGITGAPLSDKG